jgi:hypothetical protein
MQEIWASYDNSPIVNFNEPPNQYHVFSSVNVPGRKWLHVTGGWQVPADADYILIALWFDSSIPAGKLRLSNFFVGVDDKFPSRW